MKKVYISLILMIMIITLGSTCIGAQFYDTLGTKYESPTEILYTLGIINGTSEHVFSANRAVTRAEMAKLIFSVYGVDDLLVDAAPKDKIPFKDVKENAWYYDYVCAASDMKIINGYSDGTFRPNATVTYAEAVTMIIRALGYTELNVREGDTWEAPYIRKMNEIRLAKNVGYFKNSEEASRGNIAIMIWNMLNCETYMIIKEKTYAGFVRENIPGKVIDRYYPDYAIIDDDILTNVSFGMFKSGDETEVAYYIYTKEAGILEVKGPIPLRRIGVKLSGIYNIRTEEAIGLNFIYDTEFDDGATVELEDIYKLKGTRDVYTIGDSKAYAYVYMNDEGKIDRITYFGSNENYLVLESKITHDTSEVDGEKVDGPEYILINEKYKIYTSNILINEDGEALEWSKVHKDLVISQISEGLYVLHEETIRGTLQEITEKGSRLILNIDGQLYQCDDAAVYKLYNSETTKKASKKNLEEYIGKKVELKVNYAKEVMEINLERNYDNSAEIDRYGIVLEEIREEDQEDKTRIKLVTTKGTKVYKVLEDVIKSKPEEGTLVNFEMLENEIEFFDVFSDGLELPGGKLAMNLKEEKKVYERNMFGGYEIDKNTVIYVIEKEYKINSDKVIDQYRMRIESDLEILTEVKENPVHVLYDEDNVAIAIFIEKEINKHEYQYGKVLEVFEEKENKKDNETEDSKKNNEDAVEKYNRVLKIKISPFNNVISEYKIKGIIDCEPGDLISYKTNEEEIIIKERYNANLLGDKRDYIVSDFDIKSGRAELTNGDQIDFTRRKFVVDGKEYLFEKYLTVFCKVSDSSGKWKFISSSIENPKDLILKPGDRIAIDEIEDLIIIYRGYKE